MRSGQIGGALIIGGSMLLVPAAAFAGPAVIGDVDRDVRNLIVDACLALLGSGAVVLAIFGPRPLDGRSVRIGLAALAVGLVSLLVASNVSIPSGSNELQNGPWLISAALALVGMLLGAMITVLTLARASGLSQLAARLFLAGLLLMIVVSILANGAIALGPLGPVVGVLAALGGIAIVVSIAMLGVLAIRGDRSAPGASA